MNEQRQQLDELVPLVGAILGGIGRLGAGAAARWAAGAATRKAAGGAARGWATKAGKWAMGPTKGARFARSAAGHYAMAKMYGGGGGGGAGGGGEFGYGGGADDPLDRHRGLAMYNQQTSKAMPSNIDPRAVGHDAEVDDSDKQQGEPPERPNPLGKYAQIAKDKKKMSESARLREGWASKIASVARGAGGGMRRAGGGIRRGAGMAAGAAAGRYGRTAQVATIGGALGAVASRFGAKGRSQKQASAQMYGGRANPNPYSGRSIGARLGLGTSAMEEGVIGAALKGAAVGAAGYGAYRGLKKFGGGSARAGLGRVARGVMSGAGELGKHWNKIKQAGNTQSSGSESPMRKKVVNTAGSVGSALATR